jgi:hypothetical protein
MIYTLNGKPLNEATKEDAVVWLCLHKEEYVDGFESKFAGVKAWTGLFDLVVDDHVKPVDLVDYGATDQDL